MSASSTTAATISREVARRRVIAIISHPDAGKTTLTERLLTSSGAKQRFGTVKARAGRESAASDWMKMEQERGISISSAVVRFEHRDTLVNLVDTPGHEDFSEDTYRALAAVDAAVMVVDAAKGVEERTRRLFEVCRTRKMPTIVLVNKIDRPALEPLELLDDIQRQLGIEPVPESWPVMESGRCLGIVTADGRMLPMTMRDGSHTGVASAELIEEARNELELARTVFGPLDNDRFMSAEACPVHVGSALTGDGVDLLLDEIVDRVPAPLPRIDIDGNAHAVTEPFSGFIFKVQSNQDLRHRDRMAFMRVCSGHFERGMRVRNSRSKLGLTLQYAHVVQARDRSTADDAWPGDVIGLVSTGDLLVGDTLCESGNLAFPPIPTFAPDMLRRCVNTDVTKRKQFAKGLQALADEGVMQVFDPADQPNVPEPIVGGAGQLQFEVLETRMREEFRAPVRLEPLPWDVTRATTDEWLDAARDIRGTWRLRRRDGMPFLALDGAWREDHLRSQHPDIELHAIVR